MGKKKTASKGKQPISYVQVIIMMECTEKMKYDAIYTMQRKFQSFMDNWSKSKRANFSE